MSRTASIPRETQDHNRPNSASHEPTVAFLSTPVVNSAVSTSAVTIQITETEAVPEKRSRWTDASFTGFFISFLLHGIACVWLAMWAFSAAARIALPPETIMLVLEKGGTEDANLESEADLPAGGATPSFEAQETALSAVLENLHSVPDVPPPIVPEEEAPVAPRSGQGQGRGSGTGRGNGTGSGLRKPKGGRAVRQGSFTVWTIPDDPAPGENYAIVIEVRLPEKIHRYPRSDISGLVTGTDGWRQPLPGIATPLQSFLPVEDHQVQFQVDVPGAGRLVKDTVQVRSRILKEEQVLKIVF